MTPTSPSRGILYSAPPKKTTRDENASAEDESAESTDEGPTPAKTDANWTGTVPADD
ncbi:hypothetical protein [Haladaptatus salinisoli]|uniref:hypothetical protein n=1 Tax=Haladaptatus salinisoli TaxID=2884876 RepID=UPI001D0BE558|nr:hypothetical protein [Haladaptatus salinisoli]